MASTKQLRAAKLEYAKALRERGYTNHEIAKKVGWSYSTILDHLGKQPKALTSASLVKAGARRAAEQQLHTLPQLVGKLLFKIESMEQQQTEYSASLMRIEKKLSDEKKKLYVLTEFNDKDDKAA